MSVLLKARNTSQPQHAAGVDWSNPLAKDLVVFADIAGRRDAVSGKPLVPFGVTGRAVTKQGLAEVVYTGSQNHGLATTDTIPSFSGDKTLFCHFQDFVFLNSTAYRYLCGTYDGTNGFGLIAQHSTQSGFWGAFSNGALQSAGAYLPVSGFVVAVYSGGSMSLYLDGVLKATVTVADSPTGAAKFCVGTIATTGNLSTPAASLSAGLYRRALSPAEVKSLSANPWQLLAPKRRSIWVPDAVGGGVTVSATGAAASAVGVSAQVPATLPVAVAASSATGVTATITVTNATVITCTVGDAVATGVAELTNVTLPVTPGASGAAGVAASISQLLVATVGAATAVGVTAQLPVTLPVSQGAAAAQGVTAVISQPGNTTVTCNVGAADAVGVTALASYTLKATVAASSAAGVTAATGLRLAALSGDAAAAGVLAQLQRIFGTTAGDAIANGVSSTPRSSNATVPGALAGNRPTRTGQVGDDRPVQAGAARPPRIAKTTR